MINLLSGSKPTVPKIEGLSKKGVFTLKSIEDADKISNYMGKRVMLIFFDIEGVK